MSTTIGELLEISRNCLANHRSVNHRPELAVKPTRRAKAEPRLSAIDQQSAATKPKTDGSHNDDRDGAEASTMREQNGQDVRRYPIRTSPTAAAFDPLASREDQLAAAKRLNSVRPYPGDER